MNLEGINSYRIDYRAFPSQHQIRNSHIQLVLVPDSKSGPPPPKAAPGLFGRTPIFRYFAFKLIRHIG